MMPAGKIAARLALVAVAMQAPLVPAHAQGDDPDAIRIALTYHKLTREPLDLRAVAERSDAVRRVSEFDRRDATAAEVARLSAALAAADPSRDFVMRVNDSISEYDHDLGEFSVTLFQPGSYVPLRAFGDEYQLAFANADRARPIPMPKDEARMFDARLRGIGRRVVDELHFRITGSGDPAGAVTGARVVRAELVSVRVLDPTGHVLFTPNLAAAPALAGGGAASTSGTSGATAPAAFDLVAADVAGFRVGVRAKDLQATFERLFGPVTRESAGENPYPGFAGALAVNSMGCFTLPGRRTNPGPGAVCATAFFDRDDVIRSIRIERLFPWFDAEVFRRTMVQRYGPVAGAQSSGSFALGWGPEVDPALVYDRTGPHTALAAYYTANDDFMTRGSNSLPQIRVVLQLVDAAWAAKKTP